MNKKSVKIKGVVIGIVILFVGVDLVFSANVEDEPNETEHLVKPTQLQNTTQVQTPKKIQDMFNQIAVRVVSETNVYNNPPNTPDRPYGSSTEEPGEQCVFITSTVDSDGDQIYYMWDWDDGNMSDWLGPYGSGVEAGISHIWDDEGIYEVRVKAKDTYNNESGWSDPFTVTIRILRGDMNKDGYINFCDIDPFVLALVNPDEYMGQYGLDPYRGDCNRDGYLNAFDIDPFVELLFECEEGFNADFDINIFVELLSDWINI